MSLAAGAFGQRTLHSKLTAYKQVSSTRATRKVTAMSGSGRFFVGGNWKCNGTVESVEQLVKDLNAGSVPSNVDVVVAPTYLHLSTVAASISPSYKVAAQNCWTGKGGAFTGEISAEIIKNMGLEWVILGHSERRALCGETNEIVGTKVGYALSQGLNVIACIGETLQQREGGDMFKVLDAQLAAIAAAVASDWTKVVIAYEPVWAIGTGVVATPEQAQEVHAYCRTWMATNVGAGVSDKVRILYGGSVNDANCETLAGQEDVDGFLVGGASLNGASFVKICNASKATAAA